MITPKLFKAWHAHVRESTDDFFDMQEFGSGSGRLSLVALTVSVVVAAPIDHRYEWDISNQSEQLLIDESNAKSDHGVDFYSPRCSPWSRASTTAKQATSTTPG